ncbi:MAG: hypothetical protein WC607_00140 [Candidatus Micrarchaeia archaeon]
MKRFLLGLVLAATLVGAWGCTDTDGNDYGNDLFTAGTCTQSYGNKVFHDACTLDDGEAAIIEYRCYPTSPICQAFTSKCETGYCYAGACSYGAQPQEEEAVPLPSVEASPTIEAPVLEEATALPVTGSIDSREVNLNDVYLIIGGAIVIVAVAWLAASFAGKKKGKPPAKKRGRKRR